MSQKNKKQLLIIGHATHGKDTLAEIIAHTFGYTFKSSSTAAAEIFIYDLLKGKYGYSSYEECFLDRSNRRPEWYSLICEYNRNDKARLAKKIMSSVDIYVGMRDNEEVEECLRQGVFDLIIGVFDPRKPLEDRSSFNINLWEKADIVLPNAGTKEDLKKRIMLIEPLLTKNQGCKITDVNIDKIFDKNSVNLNWFDY